MSILDRILPSRRAAAAVKTEIEKRDTAISRQAQLINAMVTGGRHSFAAGQSGGAKWDYGLSSYAPTRQLDHFALRQQARNAYHDTPQAKAIVDRFADSVVDIGLKLESEPKAEILGISSEQAEEWARTVEDAFDSWAQSKRQHRAQTMNWYQSQRLYAIAQQRDNDQFVRLYYSPSRDLLSPLQFDMYDPNQIRGYAWTSTYAQFSKNDGIIRNSDGTERAYKVWYINPATGKYEQREIPHIGRRSGLPHMLHGYYSEYPGQGRGYSRLAHALQEFENLTDFSVSTVKRAINVASLIMAVENSQLDPSNPLEGILRQPGGAGPAAQMFGSESQEPETDAPEHTGMPNYTPIPEATISTPGSTAILNLRRGDTIKQLGDRNQADSYDKFVDAFTGYIAASMSIPLEVVLMKFGQNYSASRATLILFWRIAQIWQQEMATDYLNPTFETWLTLEIAAGRIAAPGWSDPRLRAAWMNCRWIGAPMPNIDPAKTYRADKGYVEMGATTLDRVSRNLNGTRAASNRSKLRREYDDLPTPAWINWGDSEPEPDSGNDEDENSDE